MRMVDSLTRSTFKVDSIITFYIVGVVSIMAGCRQYFGIFIVDMLFVNPAESFTVSCHFLAAAATVLLSGKNREVG